MKISLDSILSLNGIGKRERQEDALAPSVEPIRTNETCFVLCDGMGGHGHGDAAARIIADCLYESLHIKRDDISTDMILSALNQAYDSLDRRSVEVGEPDMGTTLTSLCLYEGGYHAVHIGDSRIYHIRPSLYTSRAPQESIIYKSWDHSLVNMLVKIGQISEEEAKIRPDRNVLMKAIQAGTGVKRATPFIQSSKDVLAGDYFFLCSDGVTDTIDDNRLLKIIAMPSKSDAEKLKEIDNICSKQSADNYSCWLLHVEDIK